jgi:hypothetical protein
MDTIIIIELGMIFGGIVVISSQLSKLIKK